MGCCCQGCRCGHGWALGDQCEFDPTSRCGLRSGVIDIIINLNRYMYCTSVAEGFPLAPAAKARARSVQLVQIGSDELVSKIVRDMNDGGVELLHTALT